MPTPPSTAKTAWTRALPCLFFLFLCATPLLDSLLPKAGVIPSGRRYNPQEWNVTLQDVWNGDVGPKIEGYFQGRSFLVHETGAFYNERMFALLGRARGVHVGRDHWLYVEDRLLEVEACQKEARITESADTVETVAQRFQESGATLMVCLIPDRARLSPQFAYPDGQIPPNRKAFLPGVEAELKKRGVRVLNLSPALIDEASRGKQVIYAEDHHWNYHGSRVSAKAAADWIRTEMAYGPPNTAAKPSGPVWEERTEEGSPRRSLISLLKFRKNSPLERLFLRSQQIIDFPPGQGWQSMPPGRTGSCGVIAISSYGRFGFAEFLQFELGRQVDALVETGQGSFYPVCRLLSEDGPRDALGRTEYDFVLWPIPEYHLMNGLREKDEFTADVPDPFSGPEIEQLTPVDFEMDGARKTPAGWITDTRAPEVELDEPEEFDRVQLRMRTSSPSMNGLVSLEDEHLLLLVNTETPVSYDFKLDKPTRHATLHLRLPESGYRLLDVEVLVGD